MITMILCWVLFAKGVIGLTLPIISTLFLAFIGGAKIVIYAYE